MAGALVAFEGIDQAGKMTQARAVQQHLATLGLSSAVRQYPEYSTPIGKLIEDALTQRVELDAQARTMLFAANRWELDGEIRKLLRENALVIVDRYSWSNVVYGLSQGFDEAWLRGLEEGLRVADLTLFVDISPEESARRKAQGRDAFEADLTLLHDARHHYRRFAEAQGWAVVSGELEAARVTQDILRCIATALSAKVPELGQVAPRG